MPNLAADAHVHSEWSWDYGSDARSAGSMGRICERAVAIGLPALVFTEHLDLEDSWRADTGDIGGTTQKYMDDRGHVTLPPFDADGYFAAIERVRHEYPQLRILAGVEFGQPHLWETKAASLLARSDFDRINGSLHMLDFDRGNRTEPTTLYKHRSADDVMWAYLEEIPRMIAGSESFEVFTHIDYAVRSWPTQTEGPFDPRRFEEGFRAAMRSLADSGRALEMNTRRLWPWIPRWWSQEGGRSLTFGSDTHGPDDLAANFPEAMMMVEALDFRPGARPEDFWTR
ncbi:PHP domain-containing protein [Frondihabitans australicus]|uniref:Histidinol-phosphatase n=1 Tax=Frondihabitans australicus TaxID=386892 RepID=A0A495IFE2_9MICO|nr:PHP domain-containing protein [Frondihabitans australicus]RKR74732.1 histidinol-phosphatase (PHP family) [Frondihabitans australicus]